jgi:hypothetical protein
MIFQKLATNSPTAEKLLGFVLYGPPALVGGWAYGSGVEMVGEALGVPTMGHAAFNVPTFAGGALEA